MTETLAWLHEVRSDLGALNSALQGFNASLRRANPAWMNDTVHDAAAFEDRMTKFRDEMIGRGGDLQRLVITETFAGLVAATPIGDKTKWKRNRKRMALGLQPLPKDYVGGRARNSWHVKVDGGPPIGDVFAALANLKPEQQVRIDNNAPHIWKLNQGWSKQAPANFVEAVYEAVAAKYARVKLEAA